MVGLLLLALALATDAAVVCAGLAAAGCSRTTLLRAVLLFAAAQALMAALGAALGASLVGLVAAWAPWAAFGLLAVLGVRMLAGEAETAAAPAPGLGGLGVLALATSVDAAAAGLTLPLQPYPWPVAAVIIGGVTGGWCALAAWLGRQLHAAAGRWALRSAGLVLIGLGLQILLSHLRG